MGVASPRTRDRRTWHTWLHKCSPLNKNAVPRQTCAQGCSVAPGGPPCWHVCTCIRPCKVAASRSGDKVAVPRLGDLNAQKCGHACGVGWLQCRARGIHARATAVTRTTWWHHAFGVARLRCRARGKHSRAIAVSRPTSAQGCNVASGGQPCRHMCICIRRCKVAVSRSGDKCSQTCVQCILGRQGRNVALGEQIHAELQWCALPRTHMAQ